MPDARVNGILIIIHPGVCEVNVTVGLPGIRDSQYLMPVAPVTELPKRRACLLNFLIPLGLGWVLVLREKQRLSVAHGRVIKYHIHKVI